MRDLEDDRNAGVIILEEDLSKILETVRSQARLDTPMRLMLHIYFPIE